MRALCFCFYVSDIDREPRRTSFKSNFLLLFFGGDNAHATIAIAHYQRDHIGRIEFAFQALGVGSLAETAPQHCHCEAE
jgi:hypothetical protein